MTFKEAFDLGVDYNITGEAEVYCISAYKRMKSLGLPTDGLKVKDIMTGEIIGTVDEDELQKYI